jgi:hypothetical protein
VEKSGISDWEGKILIVRVKMKFLQMRVAAADAFGAKRIFRLPSSNQKGN